MKSWLLALIFFISAGQSCTTNKSTSTNSVSQKEIKFFNSDELADKALKHVNKKKQLIDEMVKLGLIFQCVRMMLFIAIC